MCNGQRKWYTVSVTGFALCTMMSVLSVGLPGWAVAVRKTGMNVTISYTGLFWTCFNGTLTARTCVDGTPFWDKGLDTTTKFLVSVGAGLQVLGLAFAYYHNCCVDRQWRRRSFVVEVFAIGGGMVLFVGSLCGVAFVTFEGKKEYTGGPSLFLAIGSSCLVMTFGCLVHIFNRELDDSTASG